METGGSITDIGNLLVSDNNLVEPKQYKQDLESFLKNRCRDNLKLIVNELYTLPVEIVEDAIIAKLPKSKLIIPREKPLPKEKAPTKWEQYAKLKGIEKRKKSRMVYDDVHKEYRPRFGYKRANDNTKDWLIEIPDHEKDPNQDFFAKRTEAKNERVNKNELQRLRNIARTKNTKVRGLPIIPNDKPDKLELRAALNFAKSSDASMSKFSKKVEGEDKNIKGLKKKRKFESNYASVKSEKEKQLNMFTKIVSDKSKSSGGNIDSEKVLKLSTEGNERPKKKQVSKNRRVQKSSSKNLKRLSKKKH